MTNALQAFDEAVKSYEEDKGPFKVFATVVIRRRVLDYIRSESRHNAEVTVNPAAFGGDMPEEETDNISLQVRQEVAERSTETSDDGPARTREEITAVQATFSRYGFSFFDLTECSPRAEKTKRACAQAVRVLLENETLLAQMRQKRMLPVKEIVKNSGVSDKVLDRHRRYIIAAAEILSGDYPVLSAYLDFIRKV